MADNSIFLGKSDKREELFLPLANRHGLVTGATGGLGRVLVERLLAEGRAVTALGRNCAVGALLDLGIIVLLAMGPSNEYFRRQPAFPA